MNTRVMALVVAAGMVGGVACGAHAVTITPTTFSDVPISALAAVNAAGQITNQGNAISLRSAVIATNALGGADVINLNAGTYTLTIAGSDNNSLGGDLDINDSLTINGISAAATTIQMVPPPGAGDYKVIGVNQDGTHPGLTVAINNVTITGGRNNFPSSGTFQETGGGVDFFMTGTGCTYSMSGCTVTGNSATGSAQSHGGGVNVDSNNAASANGPIIGMMTLTNCTITNNFSDREGGGLGLFGDKHNVLLTNCTISGNHTNVVGGNGGGVYMALSYGGTITMNGGAVQNNTAAAGGGGIAIGANGNTSINTVTISGNSSTGVAGSNSIGGGVLLAQTGAAGVFSTATLTGCTISGNHANGASLGQGGGVYMVSAYPTTITKCTISQNTANSTGAGIYYGAGGAGTLTANFNRIVGNTGSGGVGMFAGAAANAEHNWWGTNTPATVVNAPADFDPWMKLGISGPGGLTLGFGGTVTAELSKNSNNAPVVATNLTALVGVPVSFGATLGTISGAQAATQSTANASATYTAGNVAGNGSASATIDGVTVNLPIVLACPPLTGTVSGGGTVCAGTSSAVSVAISSGVGPFTVTLTNGGGTLMSASPLVFNVTPGATTMYSVTSATDSRGCAVTASGSATVTVIGTPGTPTAAAASHRFVCPGGAIVLSATAPSGSVVDWFTGSCGGSAVAGGSSPTVHPTVATTYYARSRTTVGGCLSAACATVSVTMCRADFNCSGTLEVQDIFDFLNAWFSGSASADFNGGGLAVQDIFDYLNAWFAGC